jgi:acyl-CoA thioesterase FadM
MEGLRDYAGWDLKVLGTLPFMVWVRRMEIDYLRPARGDQEITITSFVREFRGPDALIECTMVDSAGKNVARCLMTVAHVDKKRIARRTGPPSSWRYSLKLPNADYFHSGLLADSGTQASRLYVLRTRPRHGSSAPSSFHVTAAGSDLELPGGGRDFG